MSTEFHRFDTDLRVMGPNGQIQLENLAGVGQMPMTAVAAETALDATTRGHLVAVDTTAGDIAIQLPASTADIDRCHWTVKNAAGANNVTIARAGGNTIDGGPGPLTLAAGEWVTLTLDHANTNWGSLLNRRAAAGGNTVTPKRDGNPITPDMNGTLFDVDTSAGAINQPLPDPATMPAGFQIGFKLNGANPLTLAPAGGATIDEAANLQMTDDNAVTWVGVVNGQWGVTADAKPTDGRATANGVVTINPGTPQTLNHNLSVRPVHLTFVRQDTNDIVHLGVEQTDVNNAVVDGNVAGAYLWRASI